MTPTESQIAQVVDQAKAECVGQIGACNLEVVCEILALALISAKAKQSRGFDRAGPPTPRAAKAEPPVVA